MTAAKVKKYLGTERFKRRDKDEEDQVGVTNGLAWTSVGGEVLMTEVIVMPGKGSCKSPASSVTSCRIRESGDDLRLRAASLGLQQDFERIDVHTMCPKARRPKTAWRASPLPRRWCRPSRESLCARRWR